ncbi:ABC transporter ATP-binding protein [Chelatococcus sp. GCM10030263]|uniref:ABC transporter ATP-binding protein n=1 Tax=Chelatococcus sp. GCM10030263 TaxID=3273387 RepID=UPI0036120417
MNFSADGPAPVGPEAQNGLPGAAARAAAPTVLALENVTKSFGGFIAVKDVSVEFTEGGVYGIIGPNGAGKTTLFNLLSGFLKPTSGQLKHRGQDVTRLSPERIARRGVVRSFQITSIFGNLTIAENLVLPIQRREEGGTAFLSRGRGDLRYGEEIDGLLTQVGIPVEWRDRPANALPYGLKRSLELGISLAAKPDLLLLDEPTAGMTMQDIKRVTDLIERIAVGRTVIVVEHNLGVIADLAKEIVVMQQGQVLTRGAYDEVRRDQRVIDAYLGTRGAHGHA